MSKLVRPAQPSNSGLSDPRSTTRGPSKARPQDLNGLRGTKRS